MPSSARFRWGRKTSSWADDSLQNQVAAGKRPFQRRVYDFFFEQLSGLVFQHLYRQSAVAFPGRLDQNMAQARTGTNQGIEGDADLLGNLVGGLEADAVDVLGQSVRIGLDLVDCALPVGFVDAHSPARADAVAMEEHHYLTD